VLHIVYSDSYWLLFKRWALLVAAQGFIADPRQYFLPS